MLRKNIVESGDAVHNQFSILNAQLSGETKLSITVVFAVIIGTVACVEHDE
jgi:hypothetical protein